MTLDKQSRRMLYKCALTIQGGHPEWTNHTCLEEAFIKCVGFSNYTVPLKMMLPEYNKMPNATIGQLIEAVTHNLK